MKILFAKVPRLRGFRPKSDRSIADFNILRSILLVVLLTGPRPLVAQDDGSPNEIASVGRQATRLRIKLPLAGSADIPLKRSLQQIAEQAGRVEQRGTVVLEFWSPPGSSGGGSEFERCLSLARFLTGPAVQNLRTVAYLPQSVSGHAVLVAMACEQIVVAQDAQLGDAGQGEDIIGPTMRGSYAEIARSRRTVPEAIALGMLDDELEISEVRTDGGGTLFVWPEELQRLRAERNDLQQVTTLVPAGQTATFGGDELRQMGIASHLASNQDQLAAALGIPPDQIEFDPSLGGEWRAIRIDVAGPINASVVERVMRTIEQQAEIQKSNFVCLRLDSAGGSVVESTRLANFLADMDASRVRTVAYVPREARGDAALVAFACDDVVVHASATLGGGGAIQITPEQAADLRPPIQQIAHSKNKNWSIMAAMIDPQLEVNRYSRGTDESRYLSVEEYAERFDAVGGGVWEKGESVTMPDELLRVDGNQAEVLGFARFVVDNFDEFQQLYQLPETPLLIGPNWVFDLVDALASPQLAGLLLFVGGFALMSELSAPGLGIGGFLATVCFVLFFWSNFLHGTAEVLEIMLFLTGLACIAVEIFVIPGFGIFGLGGAGLVLASLVLASQTFVVPTNDYQMDQLSQSMMTVAMAGVGVFSAAVLLRKYLHRLPWLGNIMLLPPTGEAKSDQAMRESVAHFQHLVGATGTAKTQLMPSGKAMIGDHLFDVITEGEMVERGAEIEVTEVWGNRIVVRHRSDGLGP